MSHFGLDIGASSIKAAQIKKEAGKLILTKVGVAVNPTGSLKMETEVEINSIAETIKKLFSDIKMDTREVALTLPENMVFSSVIDFPMMSDDQLEEAVNWEAENVIPRPLSEVSFSWRIIECDNIKKDQLKVLIVASPLKIIEKYQKLITRANLDGRIIETEAIAIGRVLKYTHPEKEYIALLQIGHDSTDIAIYFSGELLSSRTLTAAGEALTRGVAANLNMDSQDSEEYKKAYGLSKQLEGKIASSLMPVLDIISAEVKKTITNFEQKEACRIKLMLLAGGSVLMPGLAEYFTTKLGLEAQISDVTSVIQTNKEMLGIVKNQSPALMVAIGSALVEE